jgi:hypothetical protein
MNNGVSCADHLGFNELHCYIASEFGLLCKPNHTAQAALRSLNYFDVGHGRRGFSHP